MIHDKLKYALTLFFITVALASFAQDQLLLDKLTKKLENHTKQDTARVNILNKLSYETNYKDRTTSHQYAQQSYELATKLNYTKGQIYALYSLGISVPRKQTEKSLAFYEEGRALAVKHKDEDGEALNLFGIATTYYFQSKKDTAEILFNKSLQLAQKVENKDLQIRVLHNMGLLNSSQGRYDAAVELYRKAIVLAEETDDQMRQAMSYTNLGVVYNIQGRLTQSLNCYVKAMELSESVGNMSNVASNLINIGTIQFQKKDYAAYKECALKAVKFSSGLTNKVKLSKSYTLLANYYDVVDSIPQALEYYHKGLDIVSPLDLKNKVELQIKVASIYLKTGEYAKAQNYLEEAKAYVDKGNMKRWLAVINLRFSRLAAIRGNHIEAIAYANKCLAIADEINSIMEQKNAMGELAGLYAEVGDYKKAYLSHTKYKQYSDSLLNEDNIKDLTRIESQYEFDKEKLIFENAAKEQKLEIKSQRIIIWSLVAISLLIIIIALMKYRSSVLKKRLLNLKLEQKNIEIENNQRQMAMATLRLVQSADKDAACVKKLQKIEDATALGEEKHEVKELIDFYKFQSLNSSWEEFEILFTKINKDFYDNLNQRFPNLTPNERKMCVFLKLNMCNKDIAQVTFQSEEALKKARLRLRRKLELERGANLTTFIQSL